MTSVRDIVELPGMPTWVRVTMAFIGIALLYLAHFLAQPVLAGDWTWSHALPALLLALIGGDIMIAAARKRWPLVLFLDLLIVRGAGGRWR